MCHRVGRHADDVRAGNWGKCVDPCYWLNPLTELDGKTLGLIGFGRIGQAFARIAQALGMKVAVFDKAVNTTLESETLKYVTLDELWAATADVISLHCPLFDDNKGMINAETIARMKPGVMLINTSRGPLINEQDLADALAAGRGRRGGGGRTLLRAAKAGQSAALRTELPRHPAHRLGNEGGAGTADAHRGRQRHRIQESDTTERRTGQP